MQKIETTPSLSERRHPLPGIVVVVLILAVYIVIAGRTAAVLSPTMDEALHIFSGCTYWKLNDFRFQPENGLASQRWIGLGALLSGEAARLSPKEEIFRPPGEPLDQFTFLKWSGDKVLTGGRLAIVLAGAILLFLVFLWSRFLWGRPGAIVSLAFGAFSPTLLAHATLATSDVFLTLTYFASVWALLCFIRTPSLSRLLIAGLLCGLTALSKYSAIALAPVAAGMIAVIWILRRPGRPLLFAGIRLAGLAGAVLIAWTVIWTGYGFRYQAFSPDFPRGSFAAPWESLKINTLPSRTTTILKKYRLFPEAYLYGADHAYYHSRARESFFFGRTGPGGYRLYFPAAFLLKSGPVLLVGLLLLTVFLVSGRLSPVNDVGGLYFRETMWGTAIPAGLFFLLCIFSNLNIGNRHMLPVYPFLFLWLGGLWTVCRKWKYAKWLLTAGLVLHAGIAAAVAPAFLSYMNPLAGGSENGHKFFADSSYDWGQEMYLLADWLGKNSQKYDQPQLIIFAPMPPGYYGIKGRVLFQFGAKYPDSWTFPEIRPGLVAVSATILSGTYLSTDGTAWNEIDQHDYRLCRSLIKKAQKTLGSDQKAWTRYLENIRDKQAWRLVFENYSRLRIKRLLWFLRKKKPLARPGDTIFIWKLTKKLYRAGGFASEPTFSEKFVRSTLRPVLDRDAWISTVPPSIKKQYLTNRQDYEKK